MGEINKSKELSAQRITHFCSANACAGVHTTTTVPIANLILLVEFSTVPHQMAAQRGWCLCIKGHS